MYEHDLLNQHAQGRAATLCASTAHSYANSCSRARRFLQVGGGGDHGDGATDWQGQQPETVSPIDDGPGHRQSHGKGRRGTKGRGSGERRLTAADEAGPEVLR